MTSAKQGCWRRLGLAIASLLGLSAVARADPAVCEGVPPLSTAPELTIGLIADGAPRVAFVLTDAERRGCPDNTEACRAKAFLVPKNRVILAQNQGTFVCADYVAPSGAERAGWLPTAALVREPPRPVGMADWTGRWSRAEATITIKPAPTSGMLAIAGDATWGASDPGRVKRGAVNVGAIAGTVAPVMADLAFTMGDKATLPVTAGDPQTDCRVWMRRLGPDLLVDDNGNCGGMNVTFHGIYTRRP